MNVIKIFALTGLVFVSGCTLISPEMGQGDSIDEAKISDQPAVEEQAEVETAIAPDVLYMLLVAELAGQRKQYDIAMEGYLRAAKKVDDERLSERAAKIALYLKDKQRTEEAVSIWLKQDPTNLDARKIALLSALREEDKDASLEHLNYLISADPAGFEKTLFELVKIMQSENKGEFVFEVLDELAVENPNQAEVPFVQAVLAVQMGKNFIAKEKIEAALSLQPDWNKALLFQAQLATLTGPPEEAKKIIQAALKKDPDSVQLKKLLANVEIKLDELDNAIDIFEDILKQRPDDEETQYTLALVYLESKDYSKAQALFEQLVDSPRYQMQASMHMGKIEIKQGNTQKGLVWFDRVTNGPLKFDAFVTSISVLIESKQFDAAMQRLQKHQHEFPDKGVRLTLLEAEILNEQGQTQQAFDLLSEALTETPKNKDLLYTRSLIAEKLDRLDILEADLKAILAQDPNDVNALNALGYTFADRTDRYEEAEEYLSKALELQPKEFVIIDSYGWLLYRQGKMDQSLEYLQRAYDGVKEGEIAAHLVEVLWVTGRQDEARKFYDQAIDEVDDRLPLEELLLRFPGLN